MKIAAIALCLFIGCVASDRVQLINLKPEEAQQYIAQQALGLNYARKLGETPLVQLRSLYGDEKKFYVNGRAIENPEDYVQEDYLANQFHGQDGLGRAMFGYSDWNQGRLEARNANGEVRGSYQYVDPEGENVIVNYWADSLGFHQTDNRPKVVLQPIQETDEVLAARRAHELAWKEAALAAKASPDPMSDYYNANANRLYEEQSKQEQTQQLLSVANQAQSFTRYPNLQHTVVPDKSGSFSHQDSIVVNAPSARSLRQEPVEEVTSEPRGFFYSFDYPVHLIKEDPSRRRSLDSPKFKREEAQGTKIKITQVSSTVAEITLPPKQPTETVAAIPTPADSAPEISSDLTNTLIEALAAALDDVDSNDIESDKLQVLRRSRRQAPTIAVPQNTTANSTSTDSPKAKRQSNPLDTFTGLFGSIPKSLPSPSLPDASKDVPAVPTAEPPATPKTKRQALAFFTSLVGTGLSALSSARAMASSFLGKREVPSLTPPASPFDSLAGNSDLPSLSSVPGIGQFAGAVPGLGSIAPKMKREVHADDLSRNKRQISLPAVNVPTTAAPTTTTASTSQATSKAKRQALPIPADPLKTLTSTTAKPSQDASKTTTSAPKAKRQTNPLSGLSDSLNKPIPTSTSASTTVTTSTTAPKAKRQTNPLDTFTGLFGTALNKFPGLPAAPAAPTPASSTTPAAPKAKRQTNPLDTFTGLFGTALKNIPSIPGAPDASKVSTAAPSTSASKAKRQTNPLDTFSGLFGNAFQNIPIPGIPAGLPDTSKLPTPPQSTDAATAPKTKRQTNAKDAASSTITTTGPTTTAASGSSISTTAAAPKAKRQSNPLDTFSGLFGSFSQGLPSIPGLPSSPQLPATVPATDAPKPKTKRQAPTETTSTTPRTKPTLVELGGLEVFGDDANLQKAKREIVYDLPSTFISLPSK